MPVPVTLSFGAPLNASCQVGDTAYYVSTNAQLDGGFTTNGANSIVEIGQIREITPFNGSAALVKCMTDLPNSGELADDATQFILFSKDNKANLSSVLGYYADVKMVNNSTTEAELFSVGVDYFESSK
jgi:hypothetical protein